MTAGKYPQNTAQAGKTIEWLPHEIAAGQKVVLDLDGKQQIISLAQALGAPGDRVVNTFWKGPIDAKGTYGEVTKVMRYEAFDANTGEKQFGTPSIGQAYARRGTVLMKRCALIVAGLVLAAVGCFAPKYNNGDLQCQAGSHPCPDGYHCASNNTCWKNGMDPQGLDDMSQPNETGDGGAGDMALPPPLVYPPAAVWISSGGGLLQQAGGALIELTISGEFAVGAAATASTPSPTIVYGYFSSATN